MTTEIVIVDDQEFMRLSLRLVLDSQPDLRVTGEASDGVEAVRLAAELRPDVMLMDVRMPRLDGIGAAHRIRALDPGSRIILITTFDQAECAQLAAGAGVAAVLLKDVAPARLLEAIRAVAAGSPVAPDLVAPAPGGPPW